MEKLKDMKKRLIHCVETQINDNLKEVDAKELGEAIDMIKDLEEAIYYATITKAMEGDDKEDSKKHKEKSYEGLGNPYQHAQNTMFYPVYLRDMDRDYGRMYYDGNYTMGDAGARNTGSTSSPSGTRNYRDSMMPSRLHQQPYYEYPMEFLRDEREGRSPISRKNYMEAKEKSQDSAIHMKELEKYMQELTQDMTDMIQKASPEEKQLLQQKIQMLATKIK